jgi:hypothetical protein
MRTVFISSYSESIGLLDPLAKQATEEEVGKREEGGGRHMMCLSSTAGEWLPRGPADALRACTCPPHARR